ncbi:hypothetical protein B4U80_01396 [Leptotrombidium deliense]|uniref:Uncharacterized protein n=1 Tax=Leptotrombidium deliense TaxID=299467 RepID=A0A443RW08_9ACAR|nr:hypothetical protein B4U80_01396 [Leptotrombidium deliense]
MLAGTPQNLDLHYVFKKQFYRTFRCCFCLYSFHGKLSTNEIVIIGEYRGIS